MIGKTYFVFFFFKWRGFFAIFFFFFFFFFFLLFFIFGIDTNSKRKPIHILRFKRNVSKKKKDLNQKNMLQRLKKNTIFFFIKLHTLTRQRLAPLKTIPLIISILGMESDIVSGTVISRGDLISVESNTPRNM